MIHQVYWYTKKNPKVKRLEENKAADVCIVGGGMSGLSAAQKLSEAGLSVIVLECTFCGGGASGKSSGFLTPDSELQLADLLDKYGADGAEKLRKFVNGGLDLIRENIKKYNIDCDYQVQDSLFVANSKKASKKVEDEHNARLKLGYESKLYTKEEMPEVLGGKGYFGGVRYPGSFGLNSYLYCQAMKEVLEKNGVEIYEESPASEIKEGNVIAEDFSVLAKYIIVATDHFLSDFNIRKKDVYHAQTFLAVSSPMNDEDLGKIFPGDKTMVWDTDLIYQYFRPIEGNKLLFGAANLLYTYKPHEKKDFSDVVRKMQRYLKEKFNLSNVIFEYSWPGMIGVTKDFVPIAGADSKMKNVFYTSAATGLPWAAALGDYLAGKITNGREDYDQFFSPDRHYPVSNNLQIVLSKPIAFAVSHGIIKYFK